VGPALRLAGALAAAGGGALLALRAWRGRRTMAQVLAVIPLPDKGDALLRKLPRAWAALEQEILRLRAKAEAEDQIRRHLLTHLNAGVVLLDQGRNVRLFNPVAQAQLGTSSSLALGGRVVEAFREPASLRNIETAFRGTAVEWTLKRNPRVLRLRAIPFLAPALPGEEQDPAGGAHRPYLEGEDAALRLDREPLEGPAFPPPAAGPGAGSADRAWVLVTLDDVTRQEALETTRQKFISNASHELKTPVTGIRIAVENLQEGALVLPEGEPSLRSILRSVDRMTMLLEDIAELSRIETGALRLEPVALRLGAFAAEALEGTRNQALAAGVEVRLDLPAELAELGFRADPFRLGQLLDNLLSNAIKFSPGGSEVRFGIRQDGPWLAWSIEDHGPGIADSDAERIFERFYRAPSVRRIPGTGLGLAIVKHLAVLMNGEVDLQTEPGRGSTFTFRLPAAEPES
jgi:signal transduction histidine kinase